MSKSSSKSANKSTSSKSSIDETILIKLGSELTEAAFDIKNNDGDVSTCQTLLDAIRTEVKKDQMTVSLLQSTRIGISLGKAIKCFKRQQRSAMTTRNNGEGGTNERGPWSDVMQNAQGLVKDWKAVAEAETQSKNVKMPATVSVGMGPPKSVAELRARLVQHKKDLYKDPPVLPPMNLKVELKKVALPKRDNKTGQLMFCPGEDGTLKKLLSDFHPNRTPEEVLRAGSFGGTYFRPIVSAITNVKYQPDQVLRDTVLPEWIDGLDKKTYLISSMYQTNINKYKVQCGGSLGMWESSGWITEIDPYGWFQWYCRFYQGRRCDDDARQISRWAKSAGPKGRFRSQLCNKILLANSTPTDRAISPVIRQTLLHWGLEITDDVLAKHKARVGK